jgi:hypothetical protein
MISPLSATPSYISALADATLGGAITLAFLYNNVNKNPFSPQ